MEEQSLYALEKEGDIDGLMYHLKNSDSEAVRARAAQLLGKEGKDKDVIDALIDRALEDESQKVRKSAAEGLTYIDDANVVELLVKRSQDKDAELSESPDWTLMKILVEALEEGVEVVRMDAANALGRIGHEKALEPLVKALNDPDADVRREAANSLGQLEDPRAIKPLTEVLTDPNQEVRQEAAKAIGELGGEEAIKSLVEAVEDESEYVRKQAVMALGNFGREEAIDALTTALKDESKDIREAAAFSLMQVTANAPAQKSHQIREEVASKLEDMDPDVSIESIVTGLEKGFNNSIRRNSAWLLGRIGDERAVDSLIGALKDEDQQVRQFTATSLAQIGEEAVPGLIDGLKDKDPEVRKMSAFALGKIGDQQAIEPLNGIMDDEEDEDVRRFAFQALSKLRGKG